MENHWSGCDAEKPSHGSDEHENSKLSLGNQNEIVIQNQKKEAGANNDGGSLPEEPSGPPEHSLQDAATTLNAKNLSADNSDESSAEELDVNICDICGDAGREDLLATCCRCTDGAEHTYCMKIRIDKVPEGDWLCEECKLDEENEKTKRQRCGTEAVEELRTSKDHSVVKVSSKRHAEELESSSTVKKRALEVTDSSTKDARSPATRPRLQSLQGAFMKSNSFSFTNARSKIKLVDEIVLQRQKSTKERASHDTIAAKEMGNTMSFRSTNLGRSGARGSKVKRLSPKSSHVQDLRSLKNKNERISERNISVISPSSSNLSTSSCRASTPKESPSLKDDNSSEVATSKELTNLVDGIKETATNSRLESAMRSSKEARYRDNMLKDAIEAALLKKPGIYTKNRVSISNHPDEPSTRDVAALSFPMKISAFPDYEHIWQGSFEISKSGKTAEFWDGLQAHMSTCASPKVFEVANKLPEKILLNAVSRISAWPQQFENEGAKEYNIALYFFAKDVESYEKSYRVLLDDMIRGDLALIGSIGRFELLIFPSTQLPEKSNRWNMMFFLWGVFRGKKNNTLHQGPNNPEKNCIQVASSISTEKNSTIEALGSIEKDRHGDPETKVSLKSEASLPEKVTASIFSPIDGGNLVPVTTREILSFKPMTDEIVSIPNKSDSQNLVKYTRNLKLEHRFPSEEEEPNHLQMELRKRTFIDLSEDVGFNETNEMNTRLNRMGEDGSVSKKQNSNGESVTVTVTPSISSYSPERGKNPKLMLALDLNEDISSCLNGDAEDNMKIMEEEGGDEEVKAKGTEVCE